MASVSDHADSFEDNKSRVVRDLKGVAKISHLGFGVDDFKNHMALGSKIVRLALVDNRGGTKSIEHLEYGGVGQPHRPRAVDQNLPVGLSVAGSRNSGINAEQVQGGCGHSFSLMLSRLPG